MAEKNVRKSFSPIRFVQHDPLPHKREKISRLKDVSCLKKKKWAVGQSCQIQTCYFDLTKNLNECENKSKYTENNLNLTDKIALLHRNLYQIQSQKNLIFDSGYLNFTIFQKKKSERAIVPSCEIVR